MIEPSMFSLFPQFKCSKARGREVGTQQMSGLKQICSCWIWGSPLTHANCSLPIVHFTCSECLRIIAIGSLQLDLCGFHLPCLLLVSSPTPRYFFACSRCSITGCTTQVMLGVCSPAWGQERKRNFLSCFIPRWVMVISSCAELSILHGNSLFINLFSRPTHLSSQLQTPFDNNCGLWKVLEMC